MHLACRPCVISRRIRDPFRLPGHYVKFAEDPLSLIIHIAVEVP